MQYAVFGRTIHRARTLVAASVLGLAAACGSDAGPTTPPGPPVPPAPTTYTTPVGSYDVATVNAKALPVTIRADGSFTYEVVSGNITLTTDGKYSIKQTVRQTVAGVIDTFVDSTGGTWTLSGTTVNFVENQTNLTDKADWSNTGSLTFVETDAVASDTYIYKIKK